MTHEGIFVAEFVNIFEVLRKDSVENEGGEVVRIESVPECGDHIRGIECHVTIYGSIHSEIDVTFEPHVGIVIPTLSNSRGEDAEFYSEQINAIKAIEFLFARDRILLIIGLSRGSDGSFRHGPADVVLELSVKCDDEQI